MIDFIFSFKFYMNVFALDFFGILLLLPEYRAFT